MTAGYSTTPLIKKLGIKPNNKVLLVNEPVYYLDLLGEMPSGVTIGIDESSLDFIHLFIKEKDELLELLSQLKEILSKNGMIWVSWPRKASKVDADVSDAVVREAGLEIGLVDVKVCAVDEVWSGLKFMYRVKDR